MGHDLACEPVGWHQVLLWCSRATSSISTLSKPPKSQLFGDPPQPPRPREPLPTPVLRLRLDYLGHALAPAPAGWHCLPLLGSCITSSIFATPPPQKSAQADPPQPPRAREPLPTPVLQLCPDYLGLALARSPAGWHCLPLRRSRAALSSLALPPLESQPLLTHRSPPGPRNLPDTRSSALPRLLVTCTSPCAGCLTALPPSAPVLGCPASFGCPPLIFSLEVASSFQKIAQKVSAESTLWHIPHRSHTPTDPALPQ